MKPLTTVWEQDAAGSDPVTQKIAVGPLDRPFYGDFSLGKALAAADRDQIKTMPHFAFSPFRCPLPRKRPEFRISDIFAKI